MIVTDLHGDWKTYQRYRDRFFALQACGEADSLIFTGDLIHSNSEDEPDASLEIVLNVLELQQQYGNAIVYLCGNHELPHIYGFGLSKGKREYTPAFEAALSHSDKRTEVIDFLCSLPFFVRTKAGVSITHAGAAPDIKNFKEAKKLFEWDHNEQLAKARAQLADMDIEGMRRGYAKLSQTETYDELAKYYLAVTDNNDPRYDDLLVGLFATSNPEYQYVHTTLFTRCEIEYGEDDYSLMIETTLKLLSEDYKLQKVLVAGHIAIPNGHKIVANRHLRLASGCHATPREAGEYLLFDAEQQIESINHLQQCSYSLSRSKIANFQIKNALKHVIPRSSEESRLLY